MKYIYNDACNVVAEGLIGLSSVVHADKKEKDENGITLDILLGDSEWKKTLKSEFEMPYWSALSKFILDEWKASSQPIFPSPERIFASLNFCPPSSVRVVIVGTEPAVYHHPTGFAFSINDGYAGLRHHPHCTRNIMDAARWHTEGDNASHGNLNEWVERGVLLLNDVLTVKGGLKHSHRSIGWEAFTDAVVRTVSLTKQNVVFMFWGDAQSQAAKIKLVDSSKHCILVSNASKCNRTDFALKEHFEKADAYFKSVHLEPVSWALSSETDPPVNSIGYAAKKLKRARWVAGVQCESDISDEES